MKIISDRDFAKEFSVINKNKFSLQQTRSLYLGLLYELLSNKYIFPKNNDLVRFLEKVFKKKYKSYLFKSRSYLASRLLKDVSNDYDTVQISASIKLIIFYLESLEVENEISINDKKTSRKINKNIKDDTIGWYQSVSKDKK